MDSIELYRALKEAYTEENLHRISSTIIDLFRERQYGALKYIQKLVDNHTPCDGETINRVFSKLIMLYHPDRLNQAIRFIEAAKQNGDFEALYSHAHILPLLRLKPDELPVSAFVEEEDLAADFGWDTDSAGFYGEEEELEYGDSWYGEDDPFTRNGFLSAVKRKIYGSLNVDFPVTLLEDLEEIEMAEYEIEHLEGIEFCRYARVVDLSNNNLTDITELRELVRIERLYLSNNHIGYIDALYHLTELQFLDISFNDIDDLSPLFDLEALEYVNVIGNRIPSWQLEKLQLKGVTVVA
ncbi:MAG: leucine-rich repeat domain-containing protein [Bacteroidales bacterium]|nr:leucine-rich repeat domain-containing protein [Bacteroidales bacterium]